MAFIHDGNREDKLSWEVCNSAAIKLFDGTESGIQTTVANAADAAVHYYDMRGNEYNTPQPGLNIVKQGNSVKKFFVK